MAKEIRIDDIKIDPAKRTQATDLLEEAMHFWHDEGRKLIQRLTKAVEEKDVRLAVSLAKVWKGVDDRWIEIATKLAPYQAPKMSAIEINKNETKRFVICAPQVIPDKKTWLEKVEMDQRLLPKPHVISNVVKEDSGLIDEAEYEDINELYR